MYRYFFSIYYLQYKYLFTNEIQFLSRIQKYHMYIYTVIIKQTNRYCILLDIITTAYTSMYIYLGIKFLLFYML